jgi:hypothetical protein
VIELLAEVIEQRAQHMRPQCHSGTVRREPPFGASAGIRIEYTGRLLGMAELEILLHEAERVRQDLVSHARVAEAARDIRRHLQARVED